MIRDIEGTFADHRQKSPHSEVTSLAELLLKLAGEEAPDLQRKELERPLGWRPLIDQVFGRIAFRTCSFAEPGFRDLLIEEIQAGRPVALTLDNQITGCGGRGERGWAVIGLNAIGQYTFLDLISKMPKEGESGIYFTEKRVIRLDSITQRDVSCIVYCEELFARTKIRHYRKSNVGHPRDRR